MIPQPQLVTPFLILGTSLLEGFQILFIPCKCVLLGPRAALHTGGYTCLVKDVQNASSRLFLFIVVASPAIYDNREAAWWRVLEQYYFPGGIW